MWSNIVFFFTRRLLSSVLNANLQLQQIIAIIITSITIAVLGVFSLLKQHSSSFYQLCFDLQCQSIISLKKLTLPLNIQKYFQQYFVTPTTILLLLNSRPSVNIKRCTAGRGLTPENSYDCYLYELPHLRCRALINMFLQHDRDAIYKLSCKTSSAPIFNNNDQFSKLF